MLPLRAKLGFAAIFAVVIGYCIYEYFVLSFPVGHECREDKQCRGFPGRCLHQEGFVNWKLGGLYHSDGKPGVCTRRCNGDADCPPAMACAEVTSQAVGAGGAVLGDPRRQKMCAPR